MQQVKGPQFHVSGLSHKQNVKLEMEFEKSKSTRPRGHATVQGIIRTPRPRSTRMLSGQSLGVFNIGKPALWSLLEKSVGAFMLAFVCAGSCGRR